MHQLILANLKLGHYSKAKAIGLERIWWLVVGGFWGLTLFFLGVLADIFFFPGEIVLLLGFGKRVFVGEKKQQQRDRGDFLCVFFFERKRGRPEMRS